jgi:protein O-GlcNAc transferase
MVSPDKLLQRALGAFSSQDVAEAERLFKAFLRDQPAHVGALNLLTVLLMRAERFAEAEQFIARAVKLDQGSDVS